MNISVVSPWTAWSVPGDKGPYVGGYIIQYATDFAYASVRGAGQMFVPRGPRSLRFSD